MRFCARRCSPCAGCRRSPAGEPARLRCPRQPERRFEAAGIRPGTAGRRGVAVPGVARPEAAADPTPLFVLRDVSLTGAHAIPPRSTRRRPGSPSRQEGLAGRPRRDRRGDQRPLPRRRLSSQPRHRAAAGHRGRLGPHPGDRRRHHRGRAERRGRRAVRRPRRCSARSLAEQPSRLATLERQLLLINSRPGVRITDTAARGDRQRERTLPPRRLA